MIQKRNQELCKVTTNSPAKKEINVKYKSYSAMLEINNIISMTYLSVKKNNLKKTDDFLLWKTNGVINTTLII